MRIGIISHSAHTGGAERMAQNLATALSSRSDMEPFVLVPEGSASGGLGEILSSLEIEWYPVSPAPWHIGLKRSGAAQYVASSRLVAEEYATVLRRAHADLAVVNTVTNLAAPLSAVLAEIPFVLWVHGVMDLGNVSGSDVTKTICDRVAHDLAQEVVFCSQHTRGYFAARALPGQHIRNWLEVDGLETCTPDRGSEFCVVTSLERHKGVDVVIRAVAFLAGQGELARVRVYGRGPMRDDLIQLAERLGVGNQVSFEGYTAKPNEEYPRYLATIVPSVVEPLGMVALESLAKGTPVIASAAGGLPEVVVPYVSGLLFRPGDVNDLAKQMLTMMQDPAEAQRLGEAGHAFVLKNYNGDTSLRDFEGLFARVVNDFAGYRHKYTLAYDVMDMLDDRGNIGGEVAQPLPPQSLFEKQSFIEREKRIQVLMERKKVLSEINRKLR